MNGSTSFSYSPFLATYSYEQRKGLTSKNNLQDLTSKSSSKTKINQAILINPAANIRKTNKHTFAVYFPIHFKDNIGKLIIKRKYLCLQYFSSNAYLIIHVLEEKCSSKKFC